MTDASESQPSSSFGSLTWIRTHLFVRNAKVKQRHRKEPERLEAAIKELSFRCFRCGYLFNRSYNHRRHICNAHGVDEHGVPSSASDRERYRQPAKKEERKRGRKEPTQPKRVRLMYQPSPYPDPAHGPEQPLPEQFVQTARQLVVRSSSVQPFASSLIVYSPTREEDLGQVRYWSLTSLNITQMISDQKT